MPSARGSRSRACARFEAFRAGNGRCGSRKAVGRFRFMHQRPGMMGGSPYSALREALEQARVPEPPPPVMLGSKAFDSPHVTLLVESARDRAHQPA